MIRPPLPQIVVSYAVLLVMCIESIAVRYISQYPEVRHGTGLHSRGCILTILMCIRM